jgi:glutamate synthase (NADPH/NADH) large chain
VHFSAIPQAQGLYDPSFERDSCGVAAVADIKGRRSNKIVADGITALINLEHRGAAGADPTVGDGAGILLQVPETFLRAVVDFDLPEAVPDEDGGAPDGCAFAVGIAFLPSGEEDRLKAKAVVEDVVAQEGLELLGWRTVPTNPISAGVGRMALDVMPAFEQLFLAGRPGADGRRPQGLALLCVAVQPDAGVQGNADHPAAARVLRRHP